VKVHGQPVSRPGINRTHGVQLESGTEAFHKPWYGVHQANARAHGHDPLQIPINECAAWRLATAIGRGLAERVAPCVMWNYRSCPGSLTRRAQGVGSTTVPFRVVPDQCLECALFDSLAGQQDRHGDNYRWKAGEAQLTLFDHGYTFPLPGHYVGDSQFVSWRWAIGRGALVDWERGALAQLLATGDLLGLARILLPARADALRARATTMLGRGTILQVGEF
jgi:hypothetical protein